MTRTPDFDALYRSDPDPFAVGSSWYEQRKIAVVLACLARPEYDAGWDAAAGTGHLAAGLASRCRRVLATDASGVAVAALTAGPQPGPTPGPASAAEAGREAVPAPSGGRPVLPAHVSVQRSALPEVPAAARGVDLVVVSEVLYYLPDRERAATLGMLAGLGAEVVAVHWRHHPGDAFLSGADTHRELDRALTSAGLVRAVWHDDTDFVLTTHRPASTVETTP
jgi:hypothetical protein